MTRPRPPRLAEALLRLILPEQDRSYALGDLSEEYNLIVREQGGGRARLWYWGQLVRAVAPSLRRRAGDRRARAMARREAGLGASRHVLALARDARLALRVLIRHPAPAAVVVITLALGIGATTAIFTVVDSVVLRPLPFPHADRLYSLCETNARLRGACVASPTNVEDWSVRSTSFEAFGIGRNWGRIWNNGEGSSEIPAGLATPGLFEVYGVRPHLGRLLMRDDLTPGNNQVVVLSYELWASAFGSDPDIIGRVLMLDKEPFEVVGVLEAGIRIPELEWIQAWTPTHFHPTDEEQRSWRGFITSGRLREGVSLKQARAEMVGIVAQLAEEHPEVNRGWGVRVEPLRNELLGATRGRLLAFLGAVGFVLLIACVNVANVLLAHAAQRRREFAVRASLGAGRWRLVRMVLTESLLLATIGGVAGLVIAYLGVPAFIALAPAGIPRLSEVSLDGRILAFAAAITVLTTLLFGLVPAVVGTRANLTTNLKEADRSQSASRLRGILVTAEVALSFVLLVGAGLLGRTFLELARYDPGFDTDGLLLVSALANAGSFTSTEEASAGDQVARHFQNIAAEIAALPGVAVVGVGSAGPLFGGHESYRHVIEGLEPPEPGREPPVRWFDVGPRYFQALGVPIRRGRGITEQDVSGTPPVTVVNEAFVRLHWGDDGDPIGQHVRLVERGDVFEIVGVVADVQPLSPDEAVEPQMYWPQAQFPRLGAFFVIRTTEASEALVRAIGERVASYDPDLSLGTFRSMDQWLDLYLATPRFSMLLVGVFAAVALVLAAVGIYGVMAYGVSRRIQEIGLRISLGATRSDIIRLVVTGSVRLAVFGILVGGVLALGVARLLRSMLVGVPPWDPLTFMVTTVFVAVLAIASGYLPALRAARIRPVDALWVD